MDANVIGKRIAKLRKLRNMTQQQLADELSVTYKAVSKWETGNGLPDVAMMPALASTLNVSVDDIMTESDITAEGIILMKSIKIWLKSKSAKITAIALIAALIIAFGIYNLIWFRYTEIAYAPFLRNEKLSSFTSEVNSRLITVYYYDDEEIHYSFGIIKPRYLQFEGKINVIVLITDYLPEPGNFRGGLHIIHTGKVNIEQFLVLDVGEWALSPEPSRTLGATIDKYGNPIGWHPRVKDIDPSFMRYPVDSDLLYDFWLSLFEKHHDEAMALLEYAKEFFGEDAFR
jgi:transcriptional regulator with XRE-family HTH domain